MDDLKESIKERKQKGLQADYVLEPPFPREFLLDVSSMCNHACVFCANPRIDNKNVADPENVLRILTEAYEAGARRVGLHAIGEPFLAKRLPDYVAEAKRIGYEFVYLTTNGAGATPDRAKEVLDAGLDSIKFSMHAATRESYKWVHGKDDFDRVVAHIKWIHSYRASSGLKYKIYVTMVQTERTSDEVNMLRDLIGPYIDEWDPHLLNNSCGTMPENNEIGVIEAENIRGRGHKGICFQPFKSFTITSQGHMSACVLDYYEALTVSDLNGVSLKEAWHGDVYKQFRRNHLENNTKGNICYNCIHNTNEPYDSLLPGRLETNVRPPRR